MTFRQRHNYQTMTITQKARLIDRLLVAQHPEANSSTVIKISKWGGIYIKGQRLTTTGKRKSLVETEERPKTNPIFNVLIL